MLFAAENGHKDIAQLLLLISTNVTLQAQVCILLGMSSDSLLGSNWQVVERLSPELLVLDHKHPQPPQLGCLTDWNRNLHWYCNLWVILSA